MKDLKRELSIWCLAISLVGGPVAASFVLAHRQQTQPNRIADEGRKAQEAGVPHEHNPYLFMPERWEDVSYWRQGWMDARDGKETPTMHPTPPEAIEAGKKIRRDIWRDKRNAR